MFGWVDKLLASIYQRGRGLTDVSDRVAQEKRTAIRTVRDALRDAMVHAEQDREHGRDDDRAATMSSSQLASVTVQEIEDEEARQLVAEWRTRFHSIQKGWKEGGLKGMYSDERNPPGYPEPAWSELRRASDAAHDHGMNVGCVGPGWARPDDALPTRSSAHAGISRARELASIERVFRLTTPVRARRSR